ncbi:MAG TPA: enolase C-terminal domain-like protein [Candidatus Melainabacteria bacterium]|nr:enolase C-terminal domain-like protein [Candidatus Melainabacteria bacterium]
MIKIAAIQATTVLLPFRFAFKHSLASRSFSNNVIVRVVLENTETGATVFGLGESVPRDYVTGETCQSALAEIESNFAPAFLNQFFTSGKKPVEAASELIERVAGSLNVYGRRVGASFCALELAILDAAAKMEGVAIADWLAGANGQIAAPFIHYGGVIPFGKRNTLAALLLFYKFYGYKTVKLKVGDDPDLDLFTVRKARELLGSSIVIRVDANCAWNFDRTVEFSNQVQTFDIASIEQPVPYDRLDELVELNKVLKQEIVVDESLCTVQEAENLAAIKACGGFNIRISKVGGLIAAQKIVNIAHKNGISIHLGAQVGESGILTAAGRALACANKSFKNYEGAANFFLLKEDLTEENMTAGFGGLGKMPRGKGIGVKVKESNLKRFEVKLQSAKSGSATVEATGRSLHV